MHGHLWPIEALRHLLMVCTYTCWRVVATTATSLDFTAGLYNGRNTRCRLCCLWSSSLLSRGWLEEPSWAELWLYRSLRPSLKLSLSYCSYSLLSFVSCCPVSKRPGASQERLSVRGRGIAGTLLWQLCTSRRCSQSTTRRTLPCVPHCAPLAQCALPPLGPSRSCGSLRTRHLNICMGSSQKL